ncbi:hypothetical protein [Gluconobacter roseus]|uniref:Uncharacterized protein n=1 Tax=Gluconobacter roseus NBRC 3990 TaxID=1307950 RepID=A0A4Y3M5N7_9PROT|nr:hypothetical protein [Gluconobacter roseus]GBR48229.1 hypothetical protein AA3990_2045 [Gluconobacter roseus NBRC 3990]GEB03366.1 hypothetical protein GRO01_09420 [Gluconobacter roseus NBRC 3990]GLP93824.1 hypothetical protein GCM10007871_18020 [Gluconobacter roseus NBRC 3990]
MNRRDFLKLNTQVAYPWPVEQLMPDDVSDLSLDEQIYSATFIGSFVIGRDEIGDEL